MGAGEPQRVSAVVDGKKKIQSVWPDGREMVEEFDAKTGTLLLRMTRKPTVTGAEGDWIVEVGQQKQETFDATSSLIKPSMDNPIFKRIELPDLTRVTPALVLEEERMSWVHQHNTL